MADSFLLFDIAYKDDLAEKVVEHFDEVILPHAWSADSDIQIPEGSRVYAYVNDQQAVSVLHAAQQGHWQLALLPHPEAVHQQRGFGLEKDLLKAIQQSQQGEAISIDLLHCNGNVVLNHVQLGDTFHLSPGKQSGAWWQRFKRIGPSLRKLKAVVLNKWCFTTANDTEVNTVAVGAVFLQHANGSKLSRHIVVDSALNDGMCHAMILAPRSLMQMLRFFVRGLFHQQLDTPIFLGLIKSRSLRVTGNGKLVYFIDGQELESDSLSLETHENALLFISTLDSDYITDVVSQKEQCKIANLPKGEAVNMLAGKALDVIAHAATDEFKELYQVLRENATPSAVFLTLMVLSTLLASIGLYADSIPVIIGAMILAPLMGPIISLAMALARQDISLLSKSIKTLLVGLCTALGFAVLASLTLPMQLETNQISVRLSPNLLDLAVAVISGIAGAYAHARISAAKSLAGVAIAVALVPPLAVTGIGIGWMNTFIASGSFLLFLTNLAGIVFAAALTFLALGYAPFTRARKGLLVASVAVVLVSVPLFFSFMRLSDEAKVVQHLEGKQIDQVVLRQVKARAELPLVISLQLVSATGLSEQQLDKVKQQIAHSLNRDIIMEATIVIRR